MKFTTDLERFFFAKACLNHQDRLLAFVIKKKQEFIKKRNAEKVAYYDDRALVYVKKCNFWQNVVNYFEKKAHVKENLSSCLSVNLDCLMGA